ncbi:FxsA family protein, partial [Akkermansiaceae bacterium]|nr:FxsA family protein [Akkermansiaceae bacterium]
ALFLPDDCGGKATDPHYLPARTVFGKLLLLFILVPLAELYLFMTLGARLGFANTIAIIIITAIIGAALTKSQGRIAMAKFQQATSEGRMPHKEALDGLMILLAGAVLLTPGFLTDAVGFLLLVPPVRAVVRNFLAERLKGKIKVVTPGFPPQPEEETKPPSKLDDGNVIDV